MEIVRLTDKQVTNPAAINTSAEQFHNTLHLGQGQRSIRTLSGNDLPGGTRGPRRPIPEACYTLALARCTRSRRRGALRPEVLRFIFLRTPSFSAAHLECRLVVAQSPTTAPTRGRCAFRQGLRSLSTWPQLFGQGWKCERGWAIIGSQRWPDRWDRETRPFGAKTTCETKVASMQGGG